MPVRLSDVIDLSDLKALPTEFLGTFKLSNVYAKHYPLWTVKGDTSAFFALFFDNLATQLTLAGFAISLGFEAGFVWTHFMGGVGLSIFIGNAYYSLQASKVAMRSGKTDTCAQPYGINTPGAIAKTFGILGVVLAKEAQIVDQQAAMEKAWSIACCANFLGGAFEFLGAFIAPFIVKNCPQGSFLAPIAGIGVTWLGLNPLIQILSSPTAHNPIVGFLPFTLIWLNGFATDKLIGRVPTLAVAALLGIILNLLTQTGDWGAYATRVSSSTAHLGWNGLALPDLGLMGTAFTEYGSLVLGLACTNFIGTYACTISACQGGDFFSPMETMIVDGLGSMLGALLGSPYGTTVYIGHVAYKKMGGTRGYSLANGLLCLIFGLCGLHALIDAILPHEIVSGVIVVVGFSMASQCVASVPSRWVPPVLVGIGICVSDYMISSGIDNAFTFSTLGNGFVFVSFLYTFFLMMLTDRWFLAAAGVSIVLLLASACGLVHAEQIALAYTAEGTLLGSEAMAAELSPGVPGWKFVVMYGATAAMLIGFHGAQRCGLVALAEAKDFRVIQARDITRYQVRVASLVKNDSALAFQHSRDTARVAPDEDTRATSPPDRESV